VISDLVDRLTALQSTRRFIGIFPQLFQQPARRHRILSWLKNSRKSQGRCSLAGTRAVCHHGSGVTKLHQYQESRYLSGSVNCSMHIWVLVQFGLSFTPRL